MSRVWKQQKLPPLNHLKVNIRFHNVKQNNTASSYALHSLFLYEDVFKMSQLHCWAHRTRVTDGGPKKDVWEQSVVYLVLAYQCKIFLCKDIILSASLSNNLIPKCNHVPCLKKDSNEDDTHLIKKAFIWGKNAC